MFNIYRGQLAGGIYLLRCCFGCRRGVWCEEGGEGMGECQRALAILKNGSSRIDFAVCLQNSVNKTDGIKGFTAPFACAYSYTDACVEALCWTVLVAARTTAPRFSAFLKAVRCGFTWDTSGRCFRDLGYWSAQSFSIQSRADGRRKRRELILFYTLNVCKVRTAVAGATAPQLNCAAVFNARSSR